MRIRPLNLPSDLDLLLSLDTSFVTDRIYRIDSTSTSFSLIEETLASPLLKHFDLTDELGEDKIWDWGAVAELDGMITGFVALRFEAWNRRVAIWHLYVAPTARGHGLGRRLVDATEQRARVLGARCLWLETSNVNFPAIQFYRRIGFELCGLDRTLYAPDGEGAGEVALYFSRPIKMANDS